MSNLIERAYAMYVSGPTIPSCQLCKELADELETKDKEIEHLEDKLLDAKTEISLLEDQLLNTHDTFYN